MEGLTKLVNSLKPGEVQLIKHLYALKTSPEKKKRDKLFQLILEKKVSTDKEAIHLLYKSRPQSAFSQLKARLKNDILTVLMLQESSVKYKTPYAQATFDCRRALIQGEILLGRGVYCEAINILTKASRQANKYELHAEQILIDDLLRNHLIMKDGIKPFKDYSKSIKENIKKLDKTLDAKYHHYEITVPNLFKTNKESQFIEKGKQVLQQIQADYETTKSPRIGFYYYLTALFYFSYIKSFDEALKHGLELHQLVERNKVITSKSNIAGVSMEIANTYINLGNYNESIKYAKKALQCFSKGMLNELYALEKLFFAYLRKNDLKNVGTILDTAFEHKQLKYSKVFTEKWMFLNAGYHFKKGDFDQSLCMLKKSNSLIKDKSGWLLGYCLLEILNRIEKGKYDWVDYRLEAVKKVVQRYTGRDEHSNQRFVVILKLLKILMRNNYCFNTMIEKGKECFELLEGKDRQYYWNPSGYEIIRFDEWARQKAAEQSKTMIDRKQAATSV